jgi:uncharacterized repeat protein (TIGR01451 family)
MFARITKLVLGVTRTRSPKAVLVVSASMFVAAALAPSAQAFTPFDNILAGLGGSPFGGAILIPAGSTLQPKPTTPTTGTCSPMNLPAGGFLVPQPCVTVPPKTVTCNPSGIPAGVFTRPCLIPPPKTGVCKPTGLPAGGFPKPCVIQAPKPGPGVCKPQIGGGIVIRCDQVDVSGETTDLSISGKSSARRTRVGKKVTYTLTVANVSLVNATDVTVTDELDGPGTVRLAKTTKGQCDSGETDVTCDIDTLAPGQSVTIKVRIKATGKGRIVSQAATEALDPEDSEDANDDLVFKTRVLKRS